MDYTIIIPAFNEKERLSKFLPELIQEFSKDRLRGEILIIDDGSSQENYQDYLRLIHSLNKDFLKIVRLPRNQGKGAAVKAGFQVAQGDWIGFVDADGATSAQETRRLLLLAVSSEKLSGVFAARIRMLGYDIHRELYRHIMGRFFVTITSLLLHIPVYDPQCGCKFFRKKDIVGIIEDCQEKGYLFDIELMVRGLKKGLAFLEVPISWKEIPGGKVRVFKDSILMFCGLWKIKRRMDL